MGKGTLIEALVAPREEDEELDDAGDEPTTSKSPEALIANIETQLAQLRSLMGELE